jgi:hypothetical protein
LLVITGGLAVVTAKSPGTKLLLLYWQIPSSGLHHAVVPEADVAGLAADLDRRHLSCGVGARHPGEIIMTLVTWRNYGTSYARQIMTLSLLQSMTLVTLNHLHRPQDVVQLRVVPLLLPLRHA